MKPAASVVLILILAATLVLCAGCVTQPAPEQATPSPTVATPAPMSGKNPLTAYALTNADVPFTVNSEASGTPGRSAIPASVGKYGVTRVYFVAFYEETEIATTKKNFRQVICEVPGANATQAFTDVREQLVRESKSTSLLRKVEPVDITGPGDESVAFTIRYNSSTEEQYPDAVIAFRKGNIVEVLTMKSAEPDFENLQELADKAGSLVA